MASRRNGTTKWFKGIATFEELKQVYKALCKQYHPDINPDGEKSMMEINAEYDHIVESGTLHHTFDKEAPDYVRTAAEKAASAAAMKEYREIISRLVILEGLNIELCGAWLWISGTTFMHKNALKAAGCFYAPKKQMWYWRPAELAERKTRKTMSMAHIRTRYGSVAIEGEAQGKLQAG